MRPVHANGMNMMNLKDKAVLLTGAGSGIGRATALQLAQRGARLVLMGRREAPLRETASMARKLGGAAIVVDGDVTDASARKRALDVAIGEFGSLHILINNAGNVRAGRLELVQDSEIVAMIRVNLHAPILLIRDSLPHLRNSGDSAIVNVTSGIALVGVPFYATYAAVKAGLARFSESLRRELLDEGVHVMTVYPGATDTPMMATSKAGPDLGFSREAPETVAEAIVTGLERRELEIVRGGEARIAMVATNRNFPRELDERFRQLKGRLEDAVLDHRAF
jgi:uncharacterized oxidoreductase